MNGNGENLPNGDAQKKLDDFKTIHSEAFLYFLEEFEKYLKLKDKCSVQSDGSSKVKVAAPALLKVNF
ncbi:MAG: hypothetical protein ABIF92_00930 [archaeon]